MKVLVDARELGSRPTGVGRYLVQLLQRWATRTPDAGDEFVLAAPAIGEAGRGFGFRMIETGGSSGTAWEQARFPGVIRKESPDVVFCPAYTAPLWTSTPRVVTIHDLSFTAHPEWFTVREGTRRRVLTRASARAAAAVLTVSEFSAAEIESYYGVTRSKIHVIRHGIAHLRRRQGVAPERLVLFAGSVFTRRHVPELLAATARLRSEIPDLRLAVVGENRTQPHVDLMAEADALKIREAVDWIGYADDARLAELYARARAFAFVSDYEGFGLTPLEALAAGVPPIVADTAVAHETCGDAALYVQPGDVEALASALRVLIVDDAVRARLLQAAPSVLARYSWDRAASDTFAVLKQASTR
jgi:glycosyltransferase involved in cell wall biosynthesis